jgi:hypothetical protein
MGQMPGDYGKYVKIRMLESSHPFGFLTLYPIRTNAIKAYRSMLKMRERATSKRELRREIEIEELD